MDEYIKMIKKLSKKTKGLSVGIVNKDGFTFEYYFGVIDEKKTPNGSSKKMMIGSNTKILTAIGIFQLMEKGKLDLDDAITKHLADFKILSHFEYEKITIRNILMHRSGLPSDDYSIILNENRSMSELIPALKETYMASKPDTMYSYSNIAFTILGLIIEKLSGLSYPEYIDKYISKPINATFEFLKNTKEKEAGFDRISRSFDQKGKVVFDTLGVLLPAGSNTYAKLSDMMKLMKCFLDPDNQPLLQAKTIRMMMEKPQNDIYEDYEWRHGLGLFFHKLNYATEETGDIVGHGGDTIYHHSDFQMYPKLGIGIVFMTNTTQGAQEGAIVMKKLFLEELKKLDIKVSKQNLTKKSFIPLDKNTFSGKYIGSNSLMIDVKLNKKNELICKMQFLKVQLLLQEDGWFYLKPRGLAKLPLFKKMIKNLYLKTKKLCGEDVIYIKQINNENFNVMPFFGKYEHIKEIEKYKHFVGNYQRLTEMVHEKTTFKKISVHQKDGMMYIRMNTFGKNSNIYISPINENQFIVSGYGRATHETVSFSKENDKICMRLSGVKCQKIDLQ
ncbi:MAG: beta-lactamase family protein [Tenericutes bacterium]|nr:beta-lactamase family protein [Mycoplasmatota bacterium]